MDSNLVEVMIACNDPDTGNFAGEFESIEILDVIHLEGAPVAIRFDYANSCAVIDGSFYAIRDIRYWVGNWCWNEILMRPDDAGDLFNMLKIFKDWSCTEAESSVFEAFEKGNGIKDTLLRALESR